MWFLLHVVMNRKSSKTWKLRLKGSFDEGLKKNPLDLSMGRSQGGVFIVLSILWGWGIDRKTPDLYDWLGAGICLIGASVILFAPRH
jgi:hypothetical protein